MRRQGRAAQAGLGPLVGDGEPVPMAERPAVKAMQEERDPLVHPPG
jgi:hypothetical protein